MLVCIYLKSPLKSTFRPISCAFTVVKMVVKQSYTCVISLASVTIDQRDEKSNFCKSCHGTKGIKKNSSQFLSMLHASGGHNSNERTERTRKKISSTSSISIETCIYIAILILDNARYFPIFRRRSERKRKLI